MNGLGMVGMLGESEHQERCFCDFLSINGFFLSVPGLGLFALKSKQKHQNVKR